MKLAKLGKKQRADNAHFQAVWKNISQIIPKQDLDNLIDKTCEEAKLTISNKRVGYAWSGGKDSVALKFIMDQCAIEQCVLGMTHDLEYPEFLQFVTDNMPDGLTVHNSGHDLNWLAGHPQMLFPRTSNIAARWFKQVQHKAQDTFFKDRQLDILCLGRRKLDSNYTGKGSNIYTNKKGITRYSPIADWSHEMVLALMHYYALPVAPFYRWVNGWVVGSGNWAARQWTGSLAKGWGEVYSIDPSRVEFAATRLHSAKSYLEKRN